MSDQKITPAVAAAMRDLVDEAEIMSETTQSPNPDTLCGTAMDDGPRCNKPEGHQSQGDHFHRFDPRKPPAVYDHNRRSFVTKANS